MNEASNLKLNVGSGPSGSKRSVALDILLVLGTMFAIKSVMLQFDSLWTLAGPVSLVASVGVATLCLRRNNESWAELGLKKPSSMSKTLMWSIVALVVTMAAGIVIESVASSANISTGGGVDPRYSGRFADLPNNLGLFIYWVLTAWIVGGFAEEMLFRAMLFSRFERMFSRLPHPVLIAIVLQSLLFGQQHYYYQGLNGALATGGIALISGGLYIFLKRTLWPLVLSHGLSNSIGLTLIYAGVLPPG